MTPSLVLATSQDPDAPGVGATVTVIVCAYTERRWDLVVESVASVRRQVPAPSEVIVVVDYNDPLMARAAKALPGVTVVANDDAKGLAGARNTGVRAASGDIVVFLDDDARAEPGWLARMLAPYEDPSVVGVGGYVRPAWPGTDGRPGWFPPEFDWVVGCSYTGLPDRPGPIRNFIGANMSFRRQVVESAGLFATGIGRSATAPLGCEETELSIRVTQRRADSVLWYEPSAAVDHTVTLDRLTPGYFLRRCFAEGLSKAYISDLVGTADATSSERRYVSRVLAGGALRRLLRVATGHPGELAALLAMVAGLVVTTAGYGAGRAGLGAVALRLVDRRPRPNTARVVGTP